MWHPYFQFTSGGIALPGGGGGTYIPPYRKPLQRRVKNVRELLRELRAEYAAQFTAKEMAALALLEHDRAGIPSPPLSLEEFQTDRDREIAKNIRQLHRQEFIQTIEIIKQALKKRKEIKDDDEEVMQLIQGLDGE